MGLAGELLDVPTRDDAFVTVTLGDTDAVDHLVLREDGLDGDLLLEQLVAEVGLGLHVAAVDLDLQHMCLLLAHRRLRHLCVRDDADDLAVLLDALDLLVGVLGLVGLVLDVLGKRLLVLRLVPVTVHAAAELVGQVLGPHGGERAQAAGGLDIANEAHNHHGGGLDDRHRLDRLLLVLLRTRLVDIAHNVRHTGLVAHEGGEVARFRRVIARELPHAALVVGAPLARVEPEATKTGVLELAVRPADERDRERGRGSVSRGRGKRIPLLQQRRRAVSALLTSPALVQEGEKSCISFFPDL